jgi:hypothetical protein
MPCISGLSVQAITILPRSWKGTPCFLEPDQSGSFAIPVRQHTRHEEHSARGVEKFITFRRGLWKRGPSGLPNNRNKQPARRQLPFPAALGWRGRLKSAPANSNRAASPRGHSFGHSKSHSLRPQSGRKKVNTHLGIGILSMRDLVGPEGFEPSTNGL